MSCSPMCWVRYKMWRFSIPRFGDLEPRNADRRSRVIVEIIQLGADELFINLFIS